MRHRPILALCFLLGLAGSLSATDRPSAETVKNLQTITLRCQVTPQGLQLSWTPANVAPSAGIKITRSVSNPSPLYPFDGYVKWMPGTGHNSVLLPFTHKRIADGKAAYYRVCAVKQNHREYAALSNVLQVPALSIPGGQKRGHCATQGKCQSKGTCKTPGNCHHSKKSKDQKKQTKGKKSAQTVTKESASGAKPDSSQPVREIPAHPGFTSVGHKDTSLDKIPAGAIAKAKKRFSVWYGHTSHGSQITSGMRAMNRAPYTFNRSGSEDALKYVETGGDLGHRGDTRWADRTRRYLDGGGDANVIMWSWCGGCSDNSKEGIDTYLKTMSELEQAYPKRLFIYMTGHLDGSGESGNLHQRNEQIRAYCRAKGKILFDFADIESFDPDGKGRLNQRLRDTGDYYENGRRTNLFGDWIRANPNHNYALPDRAAHTHPLNGALKGQAFWVLLAKLAEKS